MEFICPYTCSYRTNSGYCGSTGGWEKCPYRQLNQSNTVVGYVPPLKQTNADRFRAKSDEELAKTISGDQIYPWCTKPCEYDSCTDCVLAWLKQEAET